MDREEKKQERSFELRSEKVRSIVGQIPSSLVRYGISVIGVVLLCLFGVAYFLPYKQVYSGTAVVLNLSNEQPSDSIEATLRLKFGDKRPTPQSVAGASIVLQSPVGKFEGKLINLSATRDTLGRQESLCLMPFGSLQRIENSEVDFILTRQSGSLLTHFFTDLTK